MDLGLTRFDLVGEAHPELLGRVVGLVAQLGLTPLRVSMRRIGDVTLLWLVQDDLDPHRALIVAEKMRAIVPIIAVDLSFHPSIHEEPS